ncbi:MAG: hypothetical protein HY720_08220 [Planctomycetes bacterium]|nr:hypothetical protein [Planctomycetota bacterium]
MDALFDLAGLDAGTLTLSASVSVGADTIDSAPVTSTVFTLAVSPSETTTPQGQAFSLTLTIAPDSVQLFSAGFLFRDAVTGADITSGDIALSLFQPDGQGNLAANPTFQLPSAFTGMANLAVTVGVLSTDLFGNRTVESTTASATVTVQAASTPLAIAWVTPSDSTFDAGSPGTFEATLQTPDPATTIASYTVFAGEVGGTVAASGIASVTAVDATHARVAATWSIPSTASGAHVIVLFVSQGAQSITGSLPFLVAPVAGASLVIQEAGPVLATAGRPTTVHFTVRDLSSLDGATLDAVFRDRTSGAVLSSTAMDPASLSKQADGSFSGAFTFTFPAEQVALRLYAVLTVSLSVNGALLASADVEVLIDPAMAPVSVTIIAAPTAVRAGEGASLTVGVSGVTADQVSVLSWALLDAGGNTVATENISPALLHPANSHLEATVEMHLSAAVPAGDDTLQVTMLDTAGQVATASQPMRVLEAVSLRFTLADGTIVEGQEEVLEAVLRPRVDVGGARWNFRNGLDLVPAGFPTGGVASGEFLPAVEADGTPAWRVPVRLTIPVGTVASSISVSFALEVIDSAGRILAGAEAPLRVEPAPAPPAPEITELKPSSALPLQEVRIEGRGFSAVLAENVVLLYSAGEAFEVRPVRLSSLVFVVPRAIRPGPALLRVRSSGRESNSVFLQVLSPGQAILPTHSSLVEASNDARLTREQRRQARQAADRLGGSAGGKGENGFIQHLDEHRTLAAMERLVQAAAILSRSSLPNAADYLSQVARVAQAEALRLLVALTSQFGETNERIIHARGLFDAADRDLAAARFDEAVRGYFFTVEDLLKLISPRKNACQIGLDVHGHLCEERGTIVGRLDLEYVILAMENPTHGKFTLQVFDLESVDGANKALKTLLFRVDRDTGVVYEDVQWNGRLDDGTAIPARDESYHFGARFEFGDEVCEAFIPFRVFTEHGLRIEPERAILCPNKSQAFEAFKGCPGRKVTLEPETVWRTSLGRDAELAANVLKATLSSGASVLDGTVTAFFDGERAEARVSLVEKRGITPSEVVICSPGQVVDFDLYDCERNAVIDSEAKWTVGGSIGTIGGDDGVFRASATLPAPGTFEFVRAEWKGHPFIATVRVGKVDRVRVVGWTQAIGIGQPGHMDVVASCAGTLIDHDVPLVVEELSTPFRLEHESGVVVARTTIQGRSTRIRFRARNEPSKDPYDVHLRVHAETGGFDPVRDDIYLTVVRVEAFESEDEETYKVASALPSGLEHFVTAKFHEGMQSDQVVLRAATTPDHSAAGLTMTWRVDDLEGISPAVGLDRRTVRFSRSPDHGIKAPIDLAVNGASVRQAFAWIVWADIRLRLSGGSVMGGLDREGETGGMLGTANGTLPRHGGGTDLVRFRAFEWVATVQPIEIVSDQDRPKLETDLTDAEEDELTRPQFDDFGLVEGRWNMARAFKNRVYLTPFAAGSRGALVEATTEAARPSMERRPAEYLGSDLYGNDLFGGTHNFDPYSLEWDRNHSKTSPGQMANTDGINRGSIRINNDATNRPVLARLHFHDEMRSFVRLKPSEAAPWIRVSDFSYVHFHDAVSLAPGSSNVFEEDPFVNDANGDMQPGPDAGYRETSEHR